MIERAALISLLTTLAACSTSGPVRELANGDAVRTLRSEQTWDLEATRRNGTTATLGTDPDVADTAVKNMRNSAGSRGSDLKTMLQSLTNSAVGAR